MNIDLAREMVRAAFRASGELQIVLHAAKAQCGETEYRDLARGIATAIDSIGSGLIKKALAAHPELEAEIDEGIAKNGRY
jgi:hypothetical protein